MWHRKGQDQAGGREGLICLPLVLHCGVLPCMYSLEERLKPGTTKGCFLSFLLARFLCGGLRSKNCSRFNPGMGKTVFKLKQWPADVIVKAGTAGCLIQPRCKVAIYSGRCFKQRVKGTSGGHQSISLLLAKGNGVGTSQVLKILSGPSWAVGQELSMM